MFGYFLNGTNNWFIRALLYSYHQVVKKFLENGPGGSVLNTLGRETCLTIGPKSIVFGKSRGQEIPKSMSYKNFQCSVSLNGM